MRHAARLLLATAMVGLLIAPPATAGPMDVQVDVPAAFAGVLPAVRQATMLPVLLPDTMPFEDISLHAGGHGRPRAYHHDLATARECGRATACFVADFSARRGARPSGLVKVRLRGGRTGWFTPMACGASCSPPSIAWRQNGAAYVFQAKVGTRATARRILVRMANQAIRAGGR
jgi:hypothetical protein